MPPTTRKMWKKSLLGLGFTREGFPTADERFQRRLADAHRGSAKLLLQKPDVLLLDEPTNHLDIESIQWLEDFLINNGKAVIVISHDRKFVDNITTRTIEVTMGRIYDYKVNYSQYLTLRKERREQQQKAYDEQQKFIAETKRVHRTLQRNVFEDVAGAEPCQDAGKAGTAGGRGRRYFRFAVEISAFAPFGKLSGDYGRCRQNVWQSRGVPQRKPDGGTWGQGCLCREERRGVNLRS